MGGDSLPQHSPGRAKRWPLNCLPGSANKAILQGLDKIQKSPYIVFVTGGLPFVRGGIECRFLEDSLKCAVFCRVRFTLARMERPL